MLTTIQKAKILGKAGFEVPACPDDSASGGADSAPESPMQKWIKAVEILYATYAAARAAKSLRDAEEARQNEMLRRMSASGIYA